MPQHAVQERCRVLANEQVAPEHNRLTLATRRIGRGAAPGQFVQLRLAEVAGAFLPRPFSFFSAAADRFTILSRAVGPGTRALARLAAGDQLDVLGPLGSGFALPAAAEAEVDGQSPVVLVGGGVGMPPLVHAAAALAPRTGVALIGAATAAMLLGGSELRQLGWQVEVATDDGSAGHRGLVTELLERHLGGYRQRAGAADAAVVLSCGPRPMLARVADLAAQLGVPCQVAMEEPMACGFGVCLGCAIAVRAAAPVTDTPAPSYALVCRDGPVFDAQRVVW